MTDIEDLRRKADELLRQASATDNMAERSRLIDEAVRCRALAEPELLLTEDEPGRPAGA
jgi:hypothetical protein